MSTRDDAVLTDKEREAFARLQAQVAADGRKFGAVHSWHVGARFHTTREWTSKVAAKAWVGPLVMVLGVLAVVAGLASSLAIAVVGLIVIAAGAVPVVTRVTRAIEKALANRPS